MTDTPFTGRKFLMIMIAFFGVVITVNLVLATQAVRTFPGTEVDNSYVASQNFDRERAAQIGLGWMLNVEYADGNLHLRFRDASGNPVRPARLEAIVGRATERKSDVTPEFRYADGAFVAPLGLGPGIWEVRLKAYSEDGTLFRQTRELLIRG